MNLNQKMEKKSINPDLILREKLALQRTILANQTTLLAFLRTSMYFLVAGLSIDNLLVIKYGFIIVDTFYVISVIVLILGIVNYLRQKRKINKSERHIGNYKAEFDMQRPNI